MITDSYGAVYQHLEYFPYGETWIEEGGSHGGNLPGYKFTGKELDPETGLYYYGARYYDPVLSKWISADPALDRLLPIGNKEHDEKLPGHGGVYNPLNLSVYDYAHGRPVVLIDPDGNITMAFEYNPWSPTGAFAVQLFENGKLIRFYGRWVTRGVNKYGQEVAIRSGLYTYENKYFKKLRTNTPRLNGTVKGDKGSGGKIPTLGPNSLHGGQAVANGVRIHQMREQPIKDPKYHGGKPYIGSEGCQGPATRGDMKRFEEGKKPGETGKYLLLRPLSQN